MEALRASGHDVLYVAELEPGITDDEVLRLAASREALLVTNDKDFGELVFRQRRASSGVLLLRLFGLPNQEKARIVTAAIARSGDEMAGGFAVLSPGQIRIRPGKDRG